MTAVPSFSRVGSHMALVPPVGQVTRAVSNAAGVQPPTIYRQFGDMQGLLDAVASDRFARYVRTKIARRRVEDPVADLRAGWDPHQLRHTATTESDVNSIP